MRDFRNAADFDASPELVTAEDLNNFPNYCPGGFNRQPISELDEITQRFAMRLKTPLRTRFEAAGRQELLPNYSDRMLDSTMQELFDDVDAAILAAGLTLEEIATAEHSGDTVREILLPVYALLRAKGYRHNELVT